MGQKLKSGACERERESQRGKMMRAKVKANWTVSASAGAVSTKTRRTPTTRCVGLSVSCTRKRWASRLSCRVSAGDNQGREPSAQATMNLEKARELLKVSKKAPASTKCSKAREENGFR